MYAIKEITSEALLYLDSPTGGWWVIKTSAFYYFFIGGRINFLKVKNEDYFIIYLHQKNR